ncbi:GNAT family N-acetyltransferase [Glycomyces halotolerans]
MHDRDLVRGLQERAARGLPAERVEHADGWWLRYAPHCSWWVGTVLPHDDSGDLERRVDAAEAFYESHGLTTRFQISPGACPERLDTMLDRRGYRSESPMSLQTAPTATVRRSMAGGPARVDDRPGRDWFDAWYAVLGHGDPRAELDLLERVQGASGYASVRLGDEIAAVGRVVVDDGWAGVFGLATLPHARGRGAARSVMVAMAAWAAARGADGMYLQVERDNPPALRLYERAGFTEACAYHYRTA